VELGGEGMEYCKFCRRRNGVQIPLKKEWSINSTEEEMECRFMLAYQLIGFFKQAGTMPKQPFQGSVVQKTTYYSQILKIC
jgi:hypothetical protein